jgi:hypothetical protein
MMKDRVDELHDNNFRILLTHMMEDPRNYHGRHGRAARLG